VARCPGVQGGSNRASQQAKSPFRREAQELKQNGAKQKPRSAGKMFATAALEAHNQWLALSAPRRVRRTHRAPGITRPYLARASWISIESESTLARAEVESLLRRSHELAFANCPKPNKKNCVSPSAKSPQHRANRMHVSKQSRKVCEAAKSTEITRSAMHQRNEQGHGVCCSPVFRPGAFALRAKNVPDQ